MSEQPVMSGTIDWLLPLLGYIKKKTLLIPAIDLKFYFSTLSIFTYPTI